METAVIIIIIGVFIFWGHYLRGIFDKRGIPDVVGLMFLGILMGPVFHLVDPASFGKFGRLFSNFVLLFILFESGTDLKISEVLTSFKDSVSITVAGFLTTTVTTFILCKLMFGLPSLASLFIGATIGGTSSAVVVGLVRKINVLPKTSATLIIESAESDVFTLAVPLGVLGLMVTGTIETNMVISKFVASLVIALMIGIGGAFLWSFIVNRIPNLKTTSFSTPAFLFILYGITEYLNYSGPLTALSFGIAIGNLEYFEPKLFQKIIPNQSIVLPQVEKDFFSQLVFLLRVFFFVFIGINIQITRLDWLVGGALITAALFVVRFIVVKLIISNDTPVLDKAIFSIMIPKGLGAAVIATLPLQQGVADGVIIQSVCFSVILFSTLYCVGLFFLIKNETLMPFYSLFYKPK